MDAEEDGAGPSVVVVESDSAGPSATVTEVSRSEIWWCWSQRVKITVAANRWREAWCACVFLDPSIKRRTGVTYVDCCTYVRARTHVRAAMASINDLSFSVKLAGVKHELYHPLLPTLRKMDMDDVAKRLPDEHSRTSTPCTRGIAIFNQRYIFCM